MPGSRTWGLGQTAQNPGSTPPPPPLATTHPVASTDDIALVTQPHVCRPAANARPNSPFRKQHVINHYIYHYTTFWAVFFGPNKTLCDPFLQDFCSYVFFSQEYKMYINLMLNFTSPQDTLKLFLPLLYIIYVHHGTWKFTYLQVYPFLPSALNSKLRFFHLELSIPRHF